MVYPRIVASLFLLVCGTFPGLSQILGNARFDGPAELPRVYVGSNLSDSLAPGKSVIVKDDVELQSALESAHCGGRILLQAGARFEGNFKFPAKNCDMPIGSSCEPCGGRSTVCGKQGVGLPFLRMKSRFTARDP